MCTDERVNDGEAEWREGAREARGGGQTRRDGVSGAGLLWDEYKTPT